MSDTDYNKCICETCGGNCGCDAEIERLRAKVAGLAATADLYRRSAEWLAANDPGTPVPEWVTYARQALAAADVECVRGWWNATSQKVHPTKVHESERPCTVVIHKEQQYGA